jgi:hypothetical protein
MWIQPLFGAPYLLEFLLLVRNSLHAFDVATTAGNTCISFHFAEVSITLPIIALLTGKSICLLKQLVHVHDLSSIRMCKQSSLILISTTCLQDPLENWRLRTSAHTRCEQRWETIRKTMSYTTTSRPTFARYHINTLLTRYVCQLDVSESSYLYVHFLLHVQAKHFRLNHQHMRAR